MFQTCKDFSAYTLRMERLDLDHVRRLARELAERREAAYAEVQGEVEAMLAWLRERAGAVAQRERELAELSSRLGEDGLAEELAAARRLAAAAEQERSLAAAERERLDEREAQIHAAEKELAALRIELEQRRPEPGRPRRRGSGSSTPARPPSTNARRRSTSASACSAATRCRSRPR